MDLTLRPMSTSQVLDRTFSLYKNNFVLFAGIAALPPALLLVAELLATFGGRAVEGLLGTFGTIAALVAGVIVFAVLYLVGTSLATGATVYAVSRTHLGHPVTIGESYGAVESLVLRIIGITMLIGLMVGGTMLLGYLVMVVPAFVVGFVAKGTGGGGLLAGLSIVFGFLVFAASAILTIWLYCTYALSVPACVVERTTVLDSLGRSKVLSQQSRFRIFLIYFLMGILAVVLSVVLSIPNYVAIFVYHGPPPLPFQVWSFVAGFLAGTLAGPIGTIAIVLVYYDNRVRKEAFDLQVMMETMGQQVAAQTASAPASGV
jgi:hypothetical protein